MKIQSKNCTCRTVPCYPANTPTALQKGVTIALEFWMALIPLAMTSTFSANRRNIFHLRYGSDVNGYEVLCNDDGTLFTGLVYEALPSGSLTAEYEVKDGLKD